MQRAYKHFENALNDLRANGGAMDYDTGMWCVWEQGELETYLVERDAVISAREATEGALAMGGMSNEQIAEELKDWKD